MSLRHIVMMRLKSGAFTPQVREDYIKTFRELREALPEEILRVRVEENVVARPQNMTVMIEMILRSEASLPLYLSHPLHRGIAARYADAIEAIASFDCHCAGSASTESGVDA